MKRSTDLLQWDSEIPGRIGVGYEKNRISAQKNEKLATSLKRSKIKTQLVGLLSAYIEFAYGLSLGTISFNDLESVEWLFEIT